MGDVLEGAQISASVQNFTSVFLFSYSGTVQKFTSILGGLYLLEVWGAQCGSYNNFGGYASGKIRLPPQTTLFIYNGGQGNKGPNTFGGWNGGGGNYASSVSLNDNSLGGGATDICLVQSAVAADSYKRYVRTAASLNSRIIVAGGAGGGRVVTSVAAGGSTGGIAATQTAPGTVSTALAPFQGGGFGFGASTGYTGDDDPAGGGGWYGGGIQRDSHGGGGSSYVLSAGSHRPVGYMFEGGHPLEMEGVRLIPGDQSQPAPSLDGVGSQTGNRGNGFTRITKFHSGNCEASKTNNSMIFPYFLVLFFCFRFS